MDQVTFNGLDAVTGDYLFPAVSLADLAGDLRAASLESSQARMLRRRGAAESEAHLGLMFGVGETDDLARTGWALVCPAGTDPSVLDALRPLLNVRRDQAGTRYHEFVLEPGESAEDFLWRLGMTSVDPVDPRKVPYYLMLVGDARKISFPTQFELDVQYAVGRLDFDTPDDYAAYAAAAVAAEAVPTPSLPLPIHLFGARNCGDTATALSASRLVEPLDEDVRAIAPTTAVTSDVGEGATKARLTELLADPAVPVLFTATHGLGRSDGDDRTLRGALVCQDWPGPLGPRGPIAPEHYLAAADVPLDRPLGPRVVFAFACYSAGSPDPAEAPYVTSLPRTLLANRERPVLAFVGHVDRAWGYSFLWQGADPQITATLSTVLAISAGRRVGAAVEFLNIRAAAATADLTSRLDALRRDGKRIDDPLLAWLWTAGNDARSYIVIGDPAVRAC